MMLLVFCGLLTLAAAQCNQQVIQPVCCPVGCSLVTAVSLITPNSKPPPGTKTPVQGTVRMTQNNACRTTSILVQLSGLPPNTPHGFHIHELGDIVTDGCQSTGGHYNPLNQPHGAPQDKIRHVGDLGNLRSDAKGRINSQVCDNVINLVGPFSVIGRAFVIHQMRDDLGRGTGAARAESLITGNAGARLGCGVILRET